MCLYPKWLESQYTFVGCGNCIECQLQKTNEWAYRIVLEARQHDKNCMITLTYNDANLPVGEALSVSDYQKFMKRLREHYAPQKIRFFCSAEYGSLKGRPHYHIILFGLDFDDKYFFCKDKKGTELFRSPTLEKLWKLGFSSITDLNYDVAKYCAKYLQKNVGNEEQPSFLRMSLRPGIGYYSIKPNYLETDKVYLDGKYIKTPRYFLNVLERAGFDLTELKDNRLKRVDTFNTLSAKERKKQLDNRKKKLRKIFGKLVDIGSFKWFWRKKLNKKTFLRKTIDK